MRSRIRSLWCALLVLVSVPAWGQPIHYSLDIAGMVCAFCAYNAAQQLKEIPGVDAASVRVDPREQRAVLRSARALDQKRAADALEIAGFRLLKVHQTAPAEAPKVESGEAWATFEFQAQRLENVTSLLSALGTKVAEQGGELHVTGPESSEKVIVKALTMGKQSPVHVDYSVRPGDTVRVVIIK